MFLLPPFIQGAKKHLEMEWNAGPLASQAAVLTARPEGCRLLIAEMLRFQTQRLTKYANKMD